MPPMEHIPLPLLLTKKSPLLSLHCLLLLALSVALFSWILLGLSLPIQESMPPFTMDSLHFFVFKLDTLCSNSAFLLLLCNAIIGALMALSKSSENPDIYTLYFKESESIRKQFGGFAEGSSKGQNWGHGTSAEICSVEKVKVQQVEIDGGDCCSDDKCIWASNLAVVPYHYQGDLSDEELNEKCDQFIIRFRRQMSLEHQAYTLPH